MPGNCRNKLNPVDNGDYLLIRSHESHCPTSYSVRGESKTKNDPQYIHFINVCLKE